ncbi:S-layer homology domain-containing protein [Paenibacillus sp. SYP-B4298]|uniref:S-layer homology domain-containing protein n=1 Tax=Paenibacillus sp. SYP-B4298 TaxID=2996034 RepID=UPI0022DE484E|nr:S-layer homology domain-containing protein [Paenibacillus sp. SYP-B4298]
MKKRILMLMLMSLVALVGVSQSAWAFKDTQNHDFKNEIEGLKQRGIISGDKHNQFKPGAKLTNAEAVVLIVKAFDLNINNLRFIKEPKVSDYYTKAKDNTWYSQAFIIAQYNQLELPQDIDPSARITREQFAHYLFNGIQRTGEYVWIEPYILMDDAKKVTDTYMNSVQKLLIMNIAKLDNKQRFQPQQSISRGEAAAWIYRAIQFVESQSSQQPQQPSYGLELQHTVSKVNDDVNKVTITATVGHPGYGLRVSSIDFAGKEATITVQVVEPDPDKMYPQVITDASVSTYIDSQYTSIKLVEAATSSPHVPVISKGKYHAG